MMRDMTMVTMIMIEEMMMTLKTMVRRRHGARVRRRAGEP